METKAKELEVVLLGSGIQHHRQGTQIPHVAVSLAGELYFAFYECLLVTQTE
jgi:hypothetical protein